ncbi:MAG: molybdopterin-dependent oxidoreductase [Lentihominibacter sp.]|nr:molybdopterin-dependent oxidoreductase [Lentihominibacter sp.]
MKQLNVLMIAIIALLSCLCMAGCGTDDIDISGYGEEKIVLSGLQKEDVEVTIRELAAMDCKTVKTHSTSDKIGEVRATGVELGTLLEQYGLSKEDISSLRFYGIDEYDVPLTREYIMEHDIYLAFGINGEPLDKESAPCRVIIPESDSAYWIRMVNRIEFN